MSVKITPIADRVLVEPAAAEQVTSSGIIIPDTAQEKQSRSGGILFWLLAIWHWFLGLFISKHQEESTDNQGKDESKEKESLLKYAGL
jgi:hypothetical protein